MSEKNACPNCGVRVKLDATRHVGTGHSDVSWLECPHCEVTNSYQSWVTPNDMDDEADPVYERTLFLSVESSEWTKAELDNLVKSVKWAVPEDVAVMGVTQNIEFLDQDQVEKMAEALVQALDDGDSGHV